MEKYMVPVSCRLREDEFGASATRDFYIGPFDTQDEVKSRRRSLLSDLSNMAFGSAFQVGEPVVIHTPKENGKMSGLLGKIFADTSDDLREKVRVIEGSLPQPGYRTRR